MKLQNRNLSIHMRGEDIALLHTELKLLGFEIADNEIEKKLFGLTTKEAVEAFQERLEFPVATGIVDKRTAALINAEIDASVSNSFFVKGTVVSRTRAGVGGLRVKIVDKIIGGDEIHLAEEITNDGGEYQVAFTISNLQERGKERPDLQAQVFASDKFLDASDVRYNASNREKLNIVLQKKADVALDSEYETLTDNLSAHFRGSLRDLKETDEQQDITHLANKTGWDARAVALAALADQFSEKTKDDNGDARIKPAFFYALFRSGLPANEDTLYQADAKSAERIWKQGIEQGVIPTALVESIPKAVEHFQGLAAKRVLDGPALAGVSGLQEMLSISLGDDESQQKEFAQFYTRYRDDPSKFWESIRSAFGEAKERRLKIDGQLAYLTLNNAPLIQKLHDSAGPDGLSDAIKLVENGYYRAKKWQEQIDVRAIPLEIPGEDDAIGYAELLAAQVRLSFPTAVVAAMVKNSETPLTNPELKNKVHSFLNDQQGKFEIGMQPVKQYLARNADIQIKSEVTQEIARIERVYQITTSNDAMNTLLAKGVDSAYAVVRYSQDEFIRVFENNLDGKANARLIYAKAQQVHNTVLNIASSYLISGITPAIGVHSPPKYINPSFSIASLQNQVATDVIAYPTLESLFGELDFCACEHCQSILSPAAYLVDLLMFCDRPVNEKENPQDVLLERRPDIEHLPLTCENTNTPLPYIDLVNEALEYYVTNSLSLTNYTGHTTDGDATPEELLASPQFVEDIAYEVLAGKPADPGDPPPLLPPISPLPFHQPLETLRRYFKKFKIPLPDVMEALRVNDDLDRSTPVDSSNPVEYGWLDILMEELELSRAEHKILTN